MPLPFIALAIPVIHSSGAWIASTAAGGYVAGTLSSTWIGALVLGNQALFGGLGLVSVAGIVGAAGGLASSAVAGAGTVLTAVGLGGVASALGIAPAVTFLGLTPVGWAIAGGGTLLAGTVGYYFTRKTMKRVNEERAKGGLEPITIPQIIREVRLLEAKSMRQILEKLAATRKDLKMLPDSDYVSINGQVFSIGKLRYVVNADGSEEITYTTKTGRRRRILLIRPAGNVAAAAS
ncbi:hypothetical protein ACEUZ9_005374 [Paracoccus litorisediminis]|uniref:hypothetical protein n=1 Tax=Paracoccus litorisediminis TaxID=2006130 RepID=UPI003731477E